MKADPQKQIFSQESLWQNARQKPAELERAMQIRGLIPMGVRWVLDAGCGSGVVANLLSDYQVIGLDFSHVALQFVARDRVEGDLNCLPFVGGQFDLVVSSEVLEHIPYRNYQGVLAEIARVANAHLIVSVPWRQRMKRSQVRCPNCACLFQPHYHMRSFDERIMADLFKNHGFRLQSLSTCGERRENLGLSSLVRWLGLSKFPPHTVCPQCGYSAEMNETVPSERREPAQAFNARQRVRSLVYRLWPRRKKQPRWWLGLYSRYLPAPAENPDLA